MGLCRILIGQRDVMFNGDSTLFTQIQTEQEVTDSFALSSGKNLDRKRHCHYLHASMENLSKNYQALDASQPWIIYWILLSLRILEGDISSLTKKRYHLSSNVVLKF